MRDRIVADRIARGKTSVLLPGPRQVGKSTLCRALEPGLYIDLADESVFLGYARDPGRLAREVAAIGNRGLVVIDEVQRLPELLNSTQSLIDRFPRALRILLTAAHV